MFDASVLDPIAVERAAGVLFSFVGNAQFIKQPGKRMVGEDVVLVGVVASPVELDACQAAQVVGIVGYLAVEQEAGLEGRCVGVVLGELSIRPFYDEVAIKRRAVRVGQEFLRHRCENLREDVAFKIREGLCVVDELPVGPVFHRDEPRAGCNWVKRIHCIEGVRMHHCEFKRTISTQEFAGDPAVLLAWTDSIIAFDERQDFLQRVVKPSAGCGAVAV